MARAVVRIYGRLRRFAVGAALQYPLLRGDPRTAQCGPLGRGGRHAARPGRRIAGHLVELAATRRRDGRGERRPAQRGLLRQIQRPRGVAGAQHRRPADGSPRRSAVHPAPRNGRAETLLGTGTHRDPVRQRTGTVLAGAGRHAPQQPSAGAARHRGLHQPLLRSGAAAPHGRGQPLRRRLLRRLQHGRGTRLRRPHAAAPQRQAGDRRGKHPDGHLRPHAVSGHRLGRRRGADRHGPARYGLRARRHAHGPGHLLRRTLRRLLRRFRAPGSAVHGHHLERRLVGRHAGLQAPVHHLAAAGHRTPPRHRPIGQYGHVGLHIGPRRHRGDPRLGKSGA